MRLKYVLQVITLTLSLFVVKGADSHDIWLLPEQFKLSKDDTLIVRQLAGTELDTALELHLLRNMTPRFELISMNGSVDLLKELAEAKTAAGPRFVLKRDLDFEGLALLTMQHDFVHDEFSTEKFAEYLKHEEYEIEKFQDQLGGRLTQSERYMRTLKSLVQVGEVSAGDLYKRILGQKIEIVLLQNPYLLNTGDNLEVQVFFNGNPLPNQLVMAFNRDQEEPVTQLKARTNDTGVARFTLDRKGIWLIRLVHLMPCYEGDAEECSDVDWESFWASITFERD